MQTDNSHYFEKVKLRERFIKTGRERVLECYAGKGLIWNDIKRRHPDLALTRIEKQAGKNKTALPGDNLKYLAAMDLSRYDLIDLDAYGIPAAQIELVARSNFKGTLFVTCIASMFGNLPMRMLESLGFTKEQYDRAPTLICRDQGRKVLGFLAIQGYNTCIGYQFGPKLYAAVSKSRATSEEHDGSGLRTARQGT